jgi:amidophosphoribosyltransferase
MNHTIHLDKLKEECGVVGIYSPGIKNISQLIYFGLHSLQHRGQESAGIAVNNEGKIQYYKEAGLVNEVFNSTIIKRLQGDIAIGHVRYSTTGENYVVNAQPLVVQHKGGSIALAHNGNLVNAMEIRDELQDQGVIFQTSIDSEVIATLIARYSTSFTAEEAIRKTMAQIKGSYALVITLGNKLIGVRDPYGLKPLCIGKLKDGYVISSESCAFNVLDAEYIRDVKPGEMVVIEDNEIHSVSCVKSEKKAFCSFEFVYFARPDSVLDGKNVYISRRNAGRILAQEHPAKADMVMAVPDSGTVSAIGYAEESGIPFGEGLIKNRYVGRTFIQPNQRLRELSVKLKLNVLKENIKGKRLVLVDDSIVRGTTSGQIVDLLKAAGAKEVHLRVSSPPIKYSCYFGIDTPTRKNLVGATHSVEEICKMVGADSLEYLSIEGLIRSIEMPKEDLCVACFSGNYPMEVPKEGNKYVFEKR